MVFFISKYKAIFKLRGFDFINYIYVQTQTNLACNFLNLWKSTCNCMAKMQKLITVAKGKAKI